MGRIPRKWLMTDGCYAHVISRSIAKQKIFENFCDFESFIKIIRMAKQEYPFELFHYCLMHTHFHLIVCVPRVDIFSDAMKQIKWEYTRKYNSLRSRRGPLWQNRFKSLVIEDEAYLYACGRYVEQNPVRAGLVLDDVEWKYSSARHYFCKEKDSLIDGYDAKAIPEGLNFNDGLDFECGIAVGSDWFKYKLKKG